jgi:hypothetical protein
MEAKVGLGLRSCEEPGGVLAEEGKAYVELGKPVGAEREWVMELLCREVGRDSEVGSGGGVRLGIHSFRFAPSSSQTWAACSSPSSKAT